MRRAGWWGTSSTDCGGGPQSRGRGRGPRGVSLAAGNVACGGLKGELLGEAVLGTLPFL
jgi:hypothetical protein